MNNTVLAHFEYDGQKLRVGFVETLDVCPGVKCHVYEFLGDPNKDLGIIDIEPGSKTPLQKVLNGDKTIEGYIFGEGELRITKKDGEKQTFKVNSGLKSPFSYMVLVGETMQWQANENSSLQVYEICFPPYKDGRYENLPE